MRRNPSFSGRGFRGTGKTFLATGTTSRNPSFSGRGFRVTPISWTLWTRCGRNPSFSGRGFREIIFQQDDCAPDVAILPLADAGLELKLDTFEAFCNSRNPSFSGRGFREQHDTRILHQTQVAILPLADAGLEVHKHAVKQRRFVVAILPLADAGLETSFFQTAAKKGLLQFFLERMRV